MELNTQGARPLFNRVSIPWINLIGQLSFNNTLGVCLRLIIVWFSRHGCCYLLTNTFCFYTKHLIVARVARMRGIFCARYQLHNFLSIQVCSVDYLLKPVKPDWQLLPHLGTLTFCSRAFFFIIKSLQENYSQESLQLLAAHVTVVNYCSSSFSPSLECG